MLQHEPLKLCRFSISDILTNRSKTTLHLWNSCQQQPAPPAAKRHFDVTEEGLQINHIFLWDHRYLAAEATVETEEATVLVCWTMLDAPAIEMLTPCQIHAGTPSPLVSILESCWPERLNINKWNTIGTEL